MRNFISFFVFTLLIFSCNERYETPRLEINQIVTVNNITSINYTLSYSKAAIPKTVGLRIKNLQTEEDSISYVPLSALNSSIDLNLHSNQQWLIQPFTSSNYSSQIGNSWLYKTPSMQPIRFYCPIPQHQLFINGSPVRIDSMYFDNQFQGIVMMVKDLEVIFSFNSQEKQGEHKIVDRYADNPPCLKLCKLMVKQNGFLFNNLSQWNGNNRIFYTKDYNKRDRISFCQIIFKSASETINLSGSVIIDL